MSLVPQSFKNSWHSLETSQLPLAFDPALTMLKFASALPVLLLFAVRNTLDFKTHRKKSTTSHFVSLFSIKIYIIF